MFINDQQPGSQSELHDAIDNESDVNPYRSESMPGEEGANSCFHSRFPAQDMAVIFYMIAHFNVFH